jgi:16S rRNA C967 or C1407 C5-methylase (RsmB/RsmF family)/NOL1/NOP2/fmu family ribosome biogenesis protein
MYPDAFLERMKHLLDTEYEAFLASTAQEPCHGLRLNVQKVQEPDFLAACPFHLSPVAWADHGFYYDSADTPGKHPYHPAGLYYIQEPSAMAAVPHLHLAPGEKVLDLCAAPGGKSTQIAGYLDGKGLLVSNEIHPARAKILSSNLERLGVTNALVCCETPERLASFFPDFFDKILVDAPCSGEGMFRKNPEAVSQWSPENSALCAARQDTVLDQASRMLKPSGLLVYSTCTFSTEENEGTLRRFLSAHPEFSLLETMRIFPHRQKGEGHFVGVLKKDGAPTQLPSCAPSEKKRKKGESASNLPTKKMPAPFEDFFRTALSKAGQDYFQTDLLCQSEGFCRFGEQLYLLPQGLPPLSGLKILRPGLHLGTIKKERFEPSHGLALVLSSHHTRLSLSFPSTSREIADYLAGQALSAAASDFPLPEGEKGWCLLLVDGYSLGWGKLSQGILKNHYPKGLRNPF